MLYHIIEFIKDTYLIGEEIVCLDKKINKFIYADIKLGDKLAVRFDNNVKERVYTYNKNYDIKLDMDDYISDINDEYSDVIPSKFCPFIAFINVYNSYKIIGDRVLQSDCHKYETRNWNSFSYKKDSKKYKKAVKEFKEHMRKIAVILPDSFYYKNS